MEQERNRSEAAEIGRRIRLVRSKLNVTQQQIAEAMQVKPVKVSQYECGKCVPRREQLVAFCALCGVSMEWMLGGGSDEIVFLRPPEEGTPRERLVQMREELGLTQAALARKLGVNSSYISHLETGRIPVTERFAERIEGRIGIGRFWILYGDSTQKEYPLTREMLEYLRSDDRLRRQIWERMEAGNAKHENEQKPGSRIQTRRREMGVTQQQLADRVHVTQASLSRIESGMVKPSRKTLDALSEALDVTREWILGVEAAE